MCILAYLSCDFTFLKYNTSDFCHCALTSLVANASSSPLAPTTFVVFYETVFLFKILVVVGTQQSPVPVA